MIALSGLIGVSIIAVFISAIRLSYAVEARSKPKSSGSGLPGGRCGAGSTSGLPSSRGSFF